MPNQQSSKLSLKYEQRNTQGTNVAIEQARPTLMEQMQFKTLHFLQTQNAKIPLSGYGQPTAQSTQLVNQSSFMNYFNLQNVMMQAEQLSKSKIDPSVITLLNEQ